MECGVVRAEAGKGFALLKFALKSEFTLKVAENHEMLLSKKVSHVLGILSGGVGWIVEVATGIKRDQLAGDDDHLPEVGQGPETCDSSEKRGYLKVEL